MKLNCYSCNQVTTATSTSHPKCLACGSEAVEFINQPTNESVNRQRPNSINQALPSRRRAMSPFDDAFQQMGGGFGNRTTGIDEMMQRMRAMMMRNMGGIDARMNRVPEMHSQDQGMRQGFNAPVFFQQRIISNPTGTFIYRSDSNNLGNEEWEHIQHHNGLNDPRIYQEYQMEQPMQQYKPKINDFPRLTSLQEECSICHTQESKGVILPCGHQFHDDCLKPWFEMKDTCPCCRYKLKQGSN